MRFLTVNLVANKKKKTIERYYIFYTLMSWFKKKKGREREKKSINYLNSECVCVCVHVFCWIMVLHCKAPRFANSKERGSGGLSRQNVLALSLSLRKNCPAKPARSLHTGKVIKLAPMRVSSLIMPAPDILLTPLSHYESWKCTAPHLTSTHW